MAEEAAKPQDAVEDYEKRLVMYVVLRKDLLKDPWKFNLGAMVAQGCHVVSKTVWELREEPNVQDYMKDMENMHKVTLGAANEGELAAIAQSLEENGIKHRVWREQPEGILTALAAMPYPRGLVAPLFKSLKLLR